MGTAQGIPEGPQPGLRRTAATALVVEDNGLMRDLLAHALKRIPGLTIVEACDGREALDRIAETAPDLILTDINMPVMDGLTLLKRVRGKEELAGIPVVVITTDAMDRARAFALGATSFVPKPVRAPHVVDEVRNLLAM